MLCPLHAVQKLPNETCASQVKERKTSVPKKQANIKQSQVPVVDNDSQISRWDSHGLFTKIVLCCSALTNIEKEMIIKFEKLSGVTILKTWDSRVTHVIASVDENGASRRTLKYLMGILEGKWILTIEWIKACLEVNKPVDEQPYEINLDIRGLIGGPKVGRSRLLNKEPKLFNGFKFYFTGDFATSYKGYLQDLIVAAGDTMLQRKPIPLHNEMQFLIYNLELPNKFKANEKNLLLSKRKSEAQALANSFGAVAISNSWILNSSASSMPIKADCRFYTCLLTYFVVNMLIVVLEFGYGVFEVLSTSGDTHLGGDDFDKRIVDWLAASFKKDEGIDLLKDKQALQPLTETAEKAKMELSTFTQANISVPFITATNDGPKHIDTTLTRAKFEELCSDLLDTYIYMLNTSFIT